MANKPAKKPNRPGSQGSPSVRRQSQVLQVDEEMPHFSSNVGSSRDGLPDTPVYMTLANQHPFVVGVLMKRKKYEGAYHFYMNCNLWISLVALCAAVAVVISEFLEHLNDNSFSELLSALNPFDRLGVLHALFPILNMICVFALVVASDLKSAAARCKALATQYSGLLEEVRRAETAGGLTADALASLQAKKQIIDVTAPQGKFVYVNPLCQLLPQCMRCEKTAQEGSLLDQNAPRSDSAGWMNSIERVTGFDLDGDGTVAGVYKTPNANRAAAASKDDDEEEEETDDDDDDSDGLPADEEAGRQKRPTAQSAEPIKQKL